MKFRFAVTITLFASLLIFANTNVAQAQWPAINSGYGMTTNYHGVDVPVFDTVVAVAGTTDSSVNKVTFKWLDPDGNEEVFDVSLLVSYITPSHPSSAPQEIIDWATDPKNDGIKVWYANDTHEPDDVEWWTVKAIFHGPTGPQGQAQHKFKATSFFVIDEVPLGTIVVLLIPFGFLGIYAMKRKRSISIQTA